MTPRMLPWLLALPLWLASCGTASLPERAALQPLDDCPSCGIMAPTPTFTSQFWTWPVAELAGSLGQPQQWTYGGNRLTLAGTEVFLVPAQMQTETQLLSVGCVQERLHQFPGVSRRAFQSTAAVDVSSVGTLADADALCSATFGADWQVARPSVTAGFWAAGQPPVELAATW
ncbi:hypothetical protein [Deinococcus aquatilis]|uniref:hypothetical protein n=1 Tax=Deinococcus aquatilis TaxID=519440 RepID=UPI0012F9BEEA|nr:hypothetical protein [Deinococcus aquatilis]